MEAFSLPPPFIKTVKALYENTHTVVAINRIFSKPYQVTRGVCQGDPLSCPLFDLAIEPLVCRFRNDPRIRGIEIPGLIKKLVVKMFADDTSLYLSKRDRLNNVQDILDQWCIVSGAKFNTEKTEIIPIGSITHQTCIITTRKVHNEDTSPLPEKICIANEGDVVHMLRAWISNNTNDITPWEPVLDKIKAKLDIWKKAHPTLEGRSTIVQAVIRGCTQYLTQVQGMLDHIEEALNDTINDFMWDEGQPRLAITHLQAPKEKGGINLQCLPKPST
jgi:hypothetical protein